MIKIAVVDTGLDLKDPRFTEHLCPSGHRDFTDYGIIDVESHGTHIAGTIQAFAGKSNFCMVIFKYYREKAGELKNTIAEVRAFQEAYRQGIKIVNFSSGGALYSRIEELFIKHHPEMTFVVAAGNENWNLDEKKYYPASLPYPNVIVVGNLQANGNRHPSSNYGKRVNAWEIGTDLKSTCPDERYCYMSGTSQAAAVFSGHLIKYLGEQK